jgi:hypothetical protein
MEHSERRLELLEEKETVLKSVVRPVLIEQPVMKKQPDIKATE